MNTFRALWKIGGAVLLAMLSACGGGGGNPGTSPGGTGTGAVSPTVSSLSFTLDKTTIRNTGSDKAQLVVTALDASRNILSGVKVDVALDSGVYTPVLATTDATGQASGTVSIGEDKTNRNITATIRAQDVSRTAVLSVTGSQISLTPLPSTPSPGGSVQVAVKASDANGAGIAAADIQLGGSLGLTQTVRTDAAGNAIATLASAPASAGTYAITARGLGVTSARDVQVVDGSASGIPNAVGSISAASLSITPNTIAPNPVGSIASRASIKAIFQNASNQAIRNVRVRFEIMPPGLGSDEQISTGSTIIYSDSSGVATADYIAGTRVSPTNGVQIRACYGYTDAEIANSACPRAVTATMTVASQPISVTIGDNNELAKTNSNLQYVKKFVVAVNDSAGLAVANALVSASVDLTHYGKGYQYSDPYYINSLSTLLTTPPSTSTNGIGSTDMPLAGTPAVPAASGAAETPATPGKRVWCANEDRNRNAFLDLGEDINANGMLDPRKADVILSYVDGNTTAADGTVIIQVQYSQNVATWLAYTVKVTTSVGGSEGTDQKSYVTSFVKGDEVNGSFLTPPYGTRRCVDAN